MAYELPSYVGDNRMYGNGETFAEGIPTLGAVLGSTLMGIDKSAGPLNWVSMTREYYIDRNNEFIMMNRTDSASGHSAWYDIFPNILFYAIADRYPNETYLNSIQNQIDSEFYTAVNVMTAGGTAPNFNWSAFDFSDNVPRYNGTWREPNMGLGMAWMQHAAYWRNRDSDPAAAALHLQAVDWALAYYETRTTNPHYEVLTGFGAYAAARMNAEHGRNFNVHKFLDWVFSRSAARPDMIMISGEQWGGEDVGGLMGGMRSCCSNPTQGYAFAMNTYVDVIAVVPIARYEDRYSRSIGKWMLNAANASRLFYGDAQGPAINHPSFGPAIRSMPSPTRGFVITGCHRSFAEAGRKRGDLRRRRSAHLRLGTAHRFWHLWLRLCRRSGFSGPDHECRKDSAIEPAGHRFLSARCPSDIFVLQPIRHGSIRGHRFGRRSL